MLLKDPYPFDRVSIKIMLHVRMPYGTRAPAFNSKAIDVRLQRINPGIIPESLPPQISLHPRTVLCHHRDCTLA